MNIDFVEPAFPSRRAWITVSAPALLALILGLVLIYLNIKLDGERNRSAAVNSVTRQAPAARTEHPHVLPYQVQALVALRKAALPEADAFAELEHVDLAGVELHSIEVDATRSEVVVELNVPNEGSLGDYLDQLNAGQEMPRWHIAKLTARPNDSRTDIERMNGLAEIKQMLSVSIVRSL